MPKIVDIKAQEVLDSKNEPTLQTTVYLDNGVLGTYTAPSGTSVGLHEAVDLKNEVNGKKTVSLAISNLSNIITPKLRGQDSLEQEKIDSLLLQLDGSKNKSNLGGNTLISVSGAVAVASAASKKLPLYRYLNQLFVKFYNGKLAIPQPMFLMIEGGAHGLFNIDFQEFLLVAPGFARVFEAQVAAKQVFYLIEQALDQEGVTKRYGLEGALAPLVRSNTHALDLIKRAVSKTKFRLNDDFYIALDCASSEIRLNNLYHLKDFENDIDASQLSNFYQGLINTFGLLSLEDPFEQSEYTSWQKFRTLHTKTLMIGDDLTCTNPQLLEQAINLKIIDGVVIKPNQVGTMTEAFQTAALAKNNNLKIVASHRSGETEDTFITDFAVAIAADYIKLGGFTQKVRAVKYDRLIQIEKEVYT